MLQDAWICHSTNYLLTLDSNGRQPIHNLIPIIKIGMDSNNLKATDLPFKIIIIVTRKIYHMNGQKYICQSSSTRKVLGNMGTDMIAVRMNNF